MTNRTPEEIARGLTELAERCEKATGPDRRLDAKIGAAARALPQAGGGDWLEAWPRPFIPAKFSGSIAAVNDAGEMVCHWEARPYTASLDAAMTLAEGFGGQVTFFKDGTAKAFLWQPYPMAVEGKAATPALALTAACLRALAVRSHLESGKS